MKSVADGDRAVIAPQFHKQVDEAPMDRWRLGAALLCRAYSPSSALTAGA